MGYMNTLETYFAFICFDFDETVSTKKCIVHELRYSVMILLYGLFENLTKCKYFGTTQTDQNANMKKLRENYI